MICFSYKKLLRSCDRFLGYRNAEIPPFHPGVESHRDHPLPDPGDRLYAGEGGESEHPRSCHTHGPQRLRGPSHFQPRAVQGQQPQDLVEISALRRRP